MRTPEDEENERLLVKGLIRKGSLIDWKELQLLICWKRPSIRS